MGIRREKCVPKLKASNIIGSYCSMVLNTRRQNKVYPNTYIGPWECDILEITKSGYTYEYEVKISRSDFKSDKMKQKRGTKKYEELRSGKRVNYFSYVCPKGLISPNEIPEWAGLVYANVYMYEDLFRGCGDVSLKKQIFFETIKSARRLSSDKVTAEVLARINLCIYYRFHALREKLL